MHRDKVREILARYPVSNPRVFGSAARGEDTLESDLDGFRVLEKRQGEGRMFFDFSELIEVHCGSVEMEVAFRVAFHGGRAALNAVGLDMNASTNMWRIEHRKTPV